MDRTDYRYNLEYRESVHAEMLAIVRTFLSGDRGVIETARLLCSYSDIPDERICKFVYQFSYINDFTDALPMGDVRQHWQPEALKLQDELIEKAELQWKDPAEEAARRLVPLLTAPIFPPGGQR